MVTKQALPGTPKAWMRRGRNHRWRRFPRVESIFTFLASLWRASGLSSRL